MKQVLVAMKLVGVVRQSVEESASRSRVIEDNGGDIHPYSTRRFGFDLEVEVGDAARVFVPGSGHRFRAARECGRAQGIARVEHVVDVAVKYFTCGIPKKPL